LTKNDRLLILILLLIGFIPWLVSSQDQTEGVAYITLQGKLYRRLELNSSPQPTDIVIRTPRGENTLRLENGAISVVDSDCPDHICQKTPAAKNPGDVIACVPHELLIEIR